MIWFSTATERDTNNWLDRECLTRKRDARRALTRFKRTKSDVDKQIYRQKRAEYKSTVKEKKQQYKTVHQALFDNKRSSCKFKNTVRRARQRKTKQPDIDISTWQNHFQNVLGNGKSHVSSRESENENNLKLNLTLMLKRM